MSVYKLLFISFVKRFYKENATAFVFVFTIMFCIINKVDGAELYEYHYSLVLSMLKSNIILFLVFLVWLLYVRKYFVFISTTINAPHYSFLQTYNQLNKFKRFKLFVTIEVLLLMPVLIYNLFIIFVALQQKLYVSLLLINLYLLLLIVIAALWHTYLLDNLNSRFTFSSTKTKSLKISSSYSFTLIHFVFRKQISIWLAIKIFTCALLYLVARNNNAVERDLSMPFLFYSIGVLANGILVFRIRTFEETQLSFYRSLPVSLLKRFARYLLVYFFLFVPEVITILFLAPAHLLFSEAINFILCGFSLLLLINSLTYIQDFKIKDYIALLLAIFFVECILFITIGMTFLYSAFLIIAVTLFFKLYNKFEGFMD